MLYCLEYDRIIMGVKMKSILIKLIELYQVTPTHMHNSCRFIPTCSEYTKCAIQEYGSLKGCYMGFRRILRCRPFGKYGYDPVKNKEEK